MQHFIVGCFCSCTLRSLLRCFLLFLDFLYTDVYNKLADGTYLHANNGCYVTER